MCSSYNGGHYLHDYIIWSSNYNMHPSVWSPSDVVWSSSSVIIILPFAVEGKFPAVHFDKKTKYVTVQSKYLNDSGLESTKDKDVILYIRGGVWDQIEFLSKRVIKDGCIGYIHGPPGSGKSFTSFLFAISQLDTFAVTWVHLNVVHKPMIIQFIDSSKKILDYSRSKYVPNAQDLNVIFQYLQETEKEYYFCRWS